MLESLKNQQKKVEFLKIICCGGWRYKYVDGWRDGCKTRSKGMQTIVHYYIITLWG